MRWLAALPCSLAILAILCAALPAAPPALRSISPPGMQAGVETRLHLMGQGFSAGMELVLPFDAEIYQEHRSPEQSVFRVKPARETPSGVYPVRVRTSAGVSNMLLVELDPLPRDVEVEPNGRLPKAQSIAWPCIVSGSLGGKGAPHPSKDVDVYKFTVTAGQRLTFVSETRRLGLTPDLVLRLRDARGRELAYCDDVPGMGVDPRLDYTFKDAGHFFLETHLSTFDYHGRNLNYQIKVGALDYARAVFPLGARRGQKVRVSIFNRDGKPSLVEARAPNDPTVKDWPLPLDDFPGSLAWRMAIGDLPEILEKPSRAGMQKIDWPVTVNGRIDGPDEVDRYRLKVKPGETVRLSVEAFYHGSALDGVLRVFDADGKMLGENLTRGGRLNPDPLLDLAVPEGVHEVTVALTDCFGRGGIEYPYRLAVDRGGPDFELSCGKEFPNTGWPESDALNLPVGEPVKLEVRVLRRGYSGPIQLRAIDLPRGVTLATSVILEGKNAGELSLTASEKAPSTLFEVGFVSEAKVDGRTIRRPLIRPIHIAEPYFTNLPWNWRLTRLVCAKVEGKR